MNDMKNVEINLNKMAVNYEYKSAHIINDVFGRLSVEYG
jgi:hypothetical protein